MANAPSPILARDLAAELHRRRGVWMTTLMIGAVGALLYIAMRTNIWEASLALMARDEATAGTGKPGKFARVEDMKTQQETVLELAKNRNVLHDVLATVGPPSGKSADGYPTDRAVDDFSDAIKVTPPKGAEFGKTEIFYLKVQDADRDRAITLASRLLIQLQDRFADIRAKKAASVTDELLRTVSLAETQLNETTVKLSTIEQEVGRDLADLRSLNEAPAGETELRKTATEVQTELRTYRAAISTNEEFLHVLRASLDDPGRLMASPMKLFEAQPALRRLKDGLVDAQIKTAQLLGALTPDHPQVIAAREAEQAIGAHLHTEITIAIKGVEVDLRVASDRVDALERQQAEVQSRFDRLASLRAEYGNLVAKSKIQTDTLRTALNELAEARASGAAAHTASLLTPVDRPDTGSRPIGAGKTVILLSGIVGGLLVGIGWILLTIDPRQFAAIGSLETVAEQQSTTHLRESSSTPEYSAPTLPISIGLSPAIAAEGSSDSIERTSSLTATVGHKVAASPLVAPEMQPLRTGVTHTMRDALQTLAVHGTTTTGAV